MQFSLQTFYYHFSYDTNVKEFLYEKFSEILKDQYGNEKETVWLLKDTVNGEYSCLDTDDE